MVKLKLRAGEMTCFTNHSVHDWDKYDKKNRFEVKEM